MKLSYRFKVSRYACRGCLDMTDKVYEADDGEKVIACCKSCAEKALAEKQDKKKKIRKKK